MALKTKTAEKLISTTVEKVTKSAKRLKEAKKGFQKIAKTTQEQLVNPILELQNIPTLDVFIPQPQETGLYQKIPGLNVPFDAPVEHLRGGGFEFLNPLKRISQRVLDWGLDRSYEKLEERHQKQYPRPLPPISQQTEQIQNSVGIDSSGFLPLVLGLIGIFLFDKNFDARGKIADKFRIIREICEDLVSNPEQKSKNRKRRLEEKNQRLRKKKQEKDKLDKLEKDNEKLKHELKEKKKAEVSWMSFFYGLYRTIPFNYRVLLWFGIMLAITFYFSDLKFFFFGGKNPKGEEVSGAIKNAFNGLSTISKTFGSLLSNTHDSFTKLSDKVLTNAHNRADEVTDKLHQNWEKSLKECKDERKSFKSEFEKCNSNRLDESTKLLKKVETITADCDSKMNKLQFSHDKEVNHLKNDIISLENEINTCENVHVSNWYQLLSVSESLDLAQLQTDIPLPRINIEGRPDKLTPTNKPVFESAGDVIKGVFNPLDKNMGKELVKPGEVKPVVKPEERPIFLMREFKKN